MKQAILINNASIETIESIIKESINKAIKEELSQKSLGINNDSKTTYLTRNQTAKKLGISLPTLHKWTLTGIIKGYRIGNSIRYKSGDIESSLEQIQSLKYRASK